MNPKKQQYACMCRTKLRDQREARLVAKLVYQLTYSWSVVTHEEHKVMELNSVVMGIRIIPQDVECSAQGISAREENITKL